MRQFIFGLAVSPIITFGAAASTHSPAVAIFELSHIHGIGFVPGNSGDVFLATHAGLYIAGTDGTAVLLSGDRNDYMGFALGDGARLYASGHPETGGNSGVIVSDDGGATWTVLSDGARGPVDFHAMSVSPADGLIYGLYQDIQVSRDGGATWTISGPGPAQIIDLAAAASGNGHVYAATMTGLMESMDYGANWAPVALTNQPVTSIEIDPAGATYAFVAGEGLYRSNAADDEWTHLASAVGKQVFLHLAVDPLDRKHLAAVTQDSRVLVSHDGGRTWVPLVP